MKVTFPFLYYFGSKIVGTIVIGVIIAKYAARVVIFPRMVIKVYKTYCIRYYVKAYTNILSTLKRMLRTVTQIDSWENVKQEWQIM